MEAVRSFKKIRVFDEHPCRDDDLVVMNDLEIS
jgi:hypothetical protein